MSHYKAPGPTAIEVHSSQAIANSEAEEIITQYIDATTESTDQLLSMSNDNMPSVVSRNHAMIQQLRRVQRDLRGLPPLDSVDVEMKDSEEVETTETTETEVKETTETKENESSSSSSDSDSSDTDSDEEEKK